MLLRLPDKHYSASSDGAPCLCQVRNAADDSASRHSARISCARPNRSSYGLTLAQQPVFKFLWCRTSRTARSSSSCFNPMPIASR